MSWIMANGGGKQGRSGRGGAAIYHVPLSINSLRVQAAGVAWMVVDGLGIV
jgi:hypothetical protein